MSALETVSNFYFPPSRLAFLNKLQVLLQQNKIIAIEGISGIGKTTLLEELLTSSMPDANKCYVTASRSINDIQVRSRIVEQLFGNVLFDPEKPLLASFFEFNQETELLIAIDNAHFLSGQIIGELLQLFSELNKAGVTLAIALCFDKSISTTLLNITSSFLDVVSVPTLSKQESYQLLVECINDVPAQTNNKVKRWIENSSGVPIQLLAFRQDGALQVSEPKLLNIKTWVAFLIAASLILTIILYVYRMDGIFNDSGLDDWFNEAKQKSIPAAQVLKQNQQVNKPADSLAHTEKKAEITVRPSASTEEIYSELTNQQYIVEKSKQTPVKVDETVKKESVSGETINVAKKDVEENQQRLDKLHELAQQLVNEANSDEQQPIQTVNSVVSEEMPVATNNDAEQQTEKDTSIIQQIESTINSDSQLDNVVTSADEGLTNTLQPSLYQINNQEFQALPADQYVLQLTAVSTEETLAKYLLSAPVSSDQLRIYKITRNKADWIVVTYGVFPSIEAARIKASELAPNAWAKSINVIQQEIENFNKQQQN